MSSLAIPQQKHAGTSRSQNQIQTATATMESSTSTVTAAAATDDTNVGRRPNNNNNTNHHNGLLWKRLIWAKFVPNRERDDMSTVTDRTTQKDGIWWPAIVYQNAMEMDDTIGDDFYKEENTDAKCKLGMAMLMNPCDQSYVQYLGRPLGDLQPIADYSYVEFVRQLQTNIRTKSCQPHAFHNDHQLYLDWHQALDDATEIMKQAMTTGSGNGKTRSSSSSSMQPTSWLQRAKEAWENNIPGSPVGVVGVGGGRGRHDHVVVGAGGVGGHSVGGGASVAAVSMLTDDSYQHGTPTRHRSVGRPSQVLRQQPQEEGEDVAAAEEGEDDEEEGEEPAVATSTVPVIQTSPIKSNESWEEVWQKLEFSDWTMILGDDGITKLYYPPKKNQSEAAAAEEEGGGGGGMTLEEVQKYTSKHYGWRQRRGAQQKPKRLTQSQASTKLGVHNSTTRQHRSSSRHQYNNADLSEEEDRKKDRKRTFGVLWKKISKDSGMDESKCWRWQKVKGPLLKKRFPTTDYLYVRPGCSVETGTLDEDYFMTSDDVLEWCSNHGVGMTSSSSEEELTPKPPPRPSSKYHHRRSDGGRGVHNHHSSPSDASSGDETMTVNHHDEDETTAAPQDSSDESEQEEEDEEEEDDDEQTFHTSQEDEESSNDVGDDVMMTPTGCKTKPQDPGKPLLSSPGSVSSLSSAYSESAHYTWGPLWKDLQRCGWRWMKAKNKLQTYWYVRPGREPNVEGEDYFVSSEDVVLYCKAMDAKDPYSKMRRHMAKMAAAKELAARRAEQEKAAREKKKNSRPKKQSKQGPDGKRAANPNTAAAAGAKQEKEASLTKKNVPARKKKKNVEDQPQPWVECPFGAAPWQLAKSAICTDYRGSSYLLTTQDGTITRKVRSLQDLRACCLQDADSYEFLPSATQDIRDDFVRWANYAFVPGQFDQWRQTRCLRRKEAEALLKKLGHKQSKKRKGGAGGSSNYVTWEPLSELVAAGALQKQYDSLSGLCRDLRRMEDLECVGGLRKRNFKSKLTSEETMELRLWLAEGLFDPPNVGASIGRPNSSDMDLDEKEDTKKYPTASPKAANKRSKKSAADQKLQRRSDPIDLFSDSECSTKICGPSEMTLEDAKELVRDLRVKVDYKTNNAPWASPLAVRDLFPKLRPLGVTHCGGGYRIPERPDLSFSSSNEVVSYWAANGNKSKLKGLNPQDRRDIGRLMDYANVPSKRPEWMTVRKLTPQEAACLLIVLGYTCNEDGSWTVPRGLPGVSETTYGSLQELCIALRQAPDLEPPAKNGNARVSRRTVQSETIHKMHLMALRLFIAEDFDIDPSALSLDEEGDNSDDESIDKFSTPAQKANVVVATAAPTTTEKEGCTSPKKCFDMVETTESLSSIKRKRGEVDIPSSEPTMDGEVKEAAAPALDHNDENALQTERVSDQPTNDSNEQLQATENSEELKMSEMQTEKDNTFEVSHAVDGNLEVSQADETMEMQTDKAGDAVTPQGEDNQEEDEVETDLIADDEEDIPGPPSSKKANQNTLGMQDTRQNDSWKASTDDNECLQNWEDSTALMEVDNDDVAQQENVESIVSKNKKNIKPSFDKENNSNAWGKSVDDYDDVQDDPISLNDGRKNEGRSSNYQQLPLCTQPDVDEGDDDDDEEEGSMGTFDPTSSAIVGNTTNNEVGTVQDSTAPYPNAFELQPILTQPGYGSDEEYAF